MPAATAPGPAPAAPVAEREAVAAWLVTAIDRRDPELTLAMVAAAVRLGVELGSVRRQLRPAASAFLSAALTDALRRS